jgi:undecaprenyl diphosphate synthase
MLWQHAYTELYFTDCLWPDFNEDELDLAIKHYLKTTRKFGAIEEYDIISEEDA